MWPSLYSELYISGSKNSLPKAHTKEKNQDACSLKQTSLLVQYQISWVQLTSMQSYYKLSHTPPHALRCSLYTKHCRVCKWPLLVIQLSALLLQICPSFDHPLLISTSCCFNMFPPHPHSTIPPANSMRHRPLTLSMSVCPFLSSPPLLFRGLFISVERWMRDWGHLQELIKPPAHTRRHTYRCRNKEKLIQGCWCITKPASAHTLALHWTQRKGKKQTTSDKTTCTNRQQPGSSYVGHVRWKV